MPKFKIQLIITLFLFISGVEMRGQEIIGDWKAHLSFNEGVKGADAGDRIYCATSSGLFFYNKSDHNVQILTRVEGLSDQKISSISYDSNRDVLVVAYENTNIDLVRENEILNIPDIKRKQLTGNKTIHNSIIIGDYTYLSCGFGIVVLNLDKNEIRDTYYIGENGSSRNVFDIEFDGTWLYAATENGLFRADINSPNLIDYNNWSIINTLPFPSMPYNRRCSGSWFNVRANSMASATPKLWLEQEKYLDGIASFEASMR